MPEVAGPTNHLPAWPAPLFWGRSGVEDRRDAECLAKAPPVPSVLLGLEWIENPCRTAPAGAIGDRPRRQTCREHDLSAHLAHSRTSATGGGASSPKLAQQFSCLLSLQDSRTDSKFPTGPR